VPNDVDNLAEHAVVLANILTALHIGLLPHICDLGFLDEASRAGASTKVLDSGEKYPAEIVSSTKKKS
jgi:hypothetical protein